MIVKNTSLFFCRSLVANLGAANYFTTEHLNDPKNIQFIEQAKIFYCAVNIFLID